MDPRVRPRSVLCALVAAKRGINNVGAGYDVPFADHEPDTCRRRSTIPEYADNESLPAWS